jgi:tRNA CCA-adding enzyme
MNSINKILKEEIELIKVDSKRFKEIKRISKEFILGLEGRLKKKGIDAQVFIGGSLAKGTLVKKDVQDVDIFVRFDGKYASEKISEMLGKVVGSKAKRVHGSRDYYQIIIDGIVLEIIPVMKVKKPDLAVNITDLSYFHVNYILKKIKKKKKLGEEIMLSKTFAHACDCYGAESYINGFSGYALELLICYYGSFLKFIKSVVKMNVGERVVIDDAKFYKNKKDVLKGLNKSKLNNVIILIDPTFKERNALAGLSDETFIKFKKYCSEFLKGPSHKFFKKHLVSEKFERVKDVRVVEVVTSKQAGDIAGTKSKKFFRYFLRELSKGFVVQKNGFEYDDVENVARFYLVVKGLGDELVKGPSVKNINGFKGFKKAHGRGVIVKKGFGWVKIKHDLSFEEWFKGFVKDRKKIVKEMSIEKLKLV